MLASLALLVLACAKPTRAPVTIESVTVPERITLTERTRVQFAADLSAVAPGVRLDIAADDASALTAIRTVGGSALVPVVGAAPVADGLSISQVRVLPVALLVPFTFPVENLSAAAAREIAAGRTRRWNEVGGPALAVEVLRHDAGTPALAFADAVTANPIQDVTAALTGGRGRVVLSQEPFIGPMVKPLRIDGLLPTDPAYPLTVRWVLVYRAGDDTAVALARAMIARNRTANDDVVIAAVGDIMLDRAVGAAIAQRGPRYPFEAVAALLQEADLRIANLELPLTERGTAARKDYVFRAPPTAAEGLAAAGFSLVTLANNHAMDYGPDGLLDTLTALSRVGVAQAGGGRNQDAAYSPTILTAKGLRIAVLAYVNTPNDSRSGWQAESVRAGPFTPGVAWGTVEAVRRDVAAAKANADVVIVALHAGWEYTAAPNPVQRQLATAAIDAGALLVLGAHPHVLQGIEMYRGVPIVYSLGNFIFDLDADDRRQPGLPSILSAVLKIRLGREGVRGLELLPVILDETDGHPVPVSGAAARPVYDRVYSLTDALRN